MLSLSTGHSTAYLTDAVAGGREGYYSAATATGEPPGVWYGAGAEALGLAGEVSADLMEALYTHLLDPRYPATHDRSTWGQARMMSAGHKHYKTPDELYAAALKQEPHATPERRAELRAHAEKTARQANAFIDATFSPDKTWSVAAVAFERARNLAYQAGDLYEAARWEKLQRTVEEAVRVGARASIDYLQDHAGYGRVGKFGPDGNGRWIDAHGWVVAQFLQHDSRDHDPQLHVHQAILNRQLCADGKWRALDSTAIKHWKAGAGAVGERAMEEYAAARAGLRTQTRADGVGRALVGVDQALVEQFSKRSGAIEPKTAELAELFRARFGREPSLHDWSRLAQQATLATRKAKEHDGETAEARMDRWEAETRAAVGEGLAATARAVADAAAQAPKPAEWSPADVKARALTTLGLERAAWRDTELTRAVDRALPAELGCGPGMVRELLEELTEEALEAAVPANKGVRADDAPAELKLDNGRSVFEAPGARTYSTPEQVVGEQLLREAAIRQGAAALSVEEATALVARYAKNGMELGADQQRALVGVLTSGAMVETIVAAPGCGKSFLLGAIADAWTASGRQMFGLATTQAATDVLAEEGLTAANVRAWLCAQERLATGKPQPGDERLRLHPGAIVAVDEASMTSWADLIAVQQVLDAHGAKLLNVGDPKQLGAVGPGGALADVVEHGRSYELTTVRRFTQEWERRASLDLREGNAKAIAEYSKHGRLVAGGSEEATERAAANAWLADTLEGKESLLLVGTNAEAARVSAALRAELVALGRVEQHGIVLGLQGTVAGVGDLVQARRNAWHLKGWEGNTAAPVNRKTYEVTAVRDDGGLTVAPILERSKNGRLLGPKMHLPANYVNQHMALGYASTAHAAEGRNVDTGHAIYGTGMDAAGFLVSMTRGHDKNTGWAVTKPAPSKEAESGEVATVKDRSPEAVALDLLERAEVERGALAQREQAERDAASASTNGDRLIEGIAQLTQACTSATLDALVAEGALSPEDRTRLAADPAAWSVDSILRRAELAGHDPAAVLSDAVRSRGFDDAESVAQALHWRLSHALDGKLTPAVRSFADLIPAGVADEWRPWLERHAAAVDERRAVLGTEVALERPQWAIEALGEPPEDPVARLDWEDKAGLAAAYRELVAHDDPADALGNAPPAGLPEKNAMWRAGHAALDLTDAGPEQRAASEGLLRCQVVAQQREEAWAPAYVADELAVVSLAEDRARETATVCAAKADACTDADPERAAVLRSEAEQAAAQLETLSEQRAALERADLDRALWAAANAVTRDKAEAARDELAARGIDLTNPPDKTTATEWVEAHRAEQAAAEAARTDLDEDELADPELEAAQPELDAQPVELGPVEDTGLAETAVPDIRETSMADAHEHVDPDERRRVPPMAETREKVERAQEAVAELQMRAELDARADETEVEAAVARYGDGTVDEDTASTGDDGSVLEYAAPARESGCYDPELS